MEAKTGLKRSAIYASIAEGKFPKQVPLGPGSVGWVEQEIDAWLTERIAERDADAGLMSPVSSRSEVLVTKTQIEDDEDKGAPDAEPP